MLIGHKLKSIQQMMGPMYLTKDLAPSKLPLLAADLPLSDPGALSGDGRSGRGHKLRPLGPGDQDLGEMTSTAKAFQETRSMTVLAASKTARFDRRPGARRHKRRRRRPRPRRSRPASLRPAPAWRRSGGSTSARFLSHDGSALPLAPDIRRTEKRPDQTPAAPTKCAKASPIPTWSRRARDIRVYADEKQGDVVFFFVIDVDLGQKDVAADGATPGRRHPLQDRRHRPCRKPTPCTRLSGFKISKGMIQDIEIMAHVEPGKGQGSGLAGQSRPGGLQVGCKKGSGFTLAKAAPAGSARRGRTVSSNASKRLRDAGGAQRMASPVLDLVADIANLRLHPSLHHVEGGVDRIGARPDGGSLG